MSFQPVPSQAQKEEKGGTTNAESPSPHPFPQPNLSERTHGESFPPTTPSSLPFSSSHQLGGGMDRSAPQENQAKKSQPSSPEEKDAIRTLLGLVVLFGLAWLGGHERVRALEERLGLTQLITSGFPFVILGLLAHTSAINILSEATLQRITPFLQFGLGWIGFHTGFQLEARRLMALPRGTATAIALLTVSPLIFIMATSSLVIWAMGQKHDWHLLLREGLMIGLAGSLSAPTLLRWLASSASEERTAFVRSMSLLDDVFVILALAVLSAWLRPSASTGWI
ncbi:MAG: hypothetical protein N2515_10005, partial [Deltaproteobacteria bacterium]|nr:hypothetical protein [Deltaproteobacteria bacterium]